MKRKAWKSSAAGLLIAATSLAATQAQAGSPTRIGDFALIDHQGAQQQLSRLGDIKAVVVIAQSNSCGENIEALHRYKLLRTTWAGKGVEFLMLNASKDDNLESIRKTAATYDIDFPIMVDDSQLVAESLKIAKAGEVLVIEPTSKSLLFHGPLDRAAPSGRDDDGGGALPNANAKPASSPLADAIGRAVEGKFDSTDTVTLPPPAKGCALSFPAQVAQAKNVPDYEKDVAPILKQNCARCHVEGGIAPFAMNSYQIVQGFSPMIREVLLTKRMPPVQVDPTVGHFDNANYISNDQLQTLVHWIDAGSPRGTSKKDPMLSVKPVKTEWQLGKPDLVVEVPAFDVPATGVIDYFNHTIDLPFHEDRYVKAVQFIPGDTRVLHHLLSYITSPDFDRSKVIQEDNVRDFLEGYAPGKVDATTFPKDTGVFIPAGNKLVLQMHYTPMGKAVTDKTRVGLYFYPKGQEPTYKYQTLPISNGGRNLNILPNEMTHRMTAQHVFADDTMLYALRPHMHYRGKAFRFKAIYPDGSSEILMNVPNYNFAWQPTYRLSTPKLLPAGTRVVTDGIFDNSKYNAGNPDPSALVKGGPQSWDEMFIGYFTYTQPKDAKDKDKLTGQLQR